MTSDERLIEEVLDELTPAGGGLTQDVMRRVIREALLKFVTKQELEKMSSNF